MLAMLVQLKLTAWQRPQSRPLQHHSLYVFHCRTLDNIGVGSLQKKKKKERGICLHIGFLNDQTTNVKEDC